MYTRRSSIRSVEEPGQDSFLDIVANLVGILIILVMVVAVRAREAIVVSRTSKDQPVEKTDLVTPQRAVEAVTADIHRIDRLMERQDFEIAFRRKERDKVLAALTAMEHDVESRRQQLS